MVSYEKILGERSEGEALHSGERGSGTANWL